MIQTIQPKTPPAQAKQNGLKYAALTVLLLCVGLYFVRLGSFGITEGGESYYPAAVREMLEAGNMLIPRLNYQMYFSKPILTFWLIGSAYSVFGVNEFASRLWSAVLSTVLVFFCYWTSRAIAGTRAGFIAALCLASSPLLLGTCRRSSIDVFFSCFVGAAICSTMMVLFARRKNWVPAAYVALGLAMLTKGPAALVLYLLGVALFLIWSRAGWNQITGYIRSMKVLPGLAIFSAIVLPWFAMIGIATKGLFLKAFFIYENLVRFAGHTNTKHSYAGWYLVTLLYGFFPWCVYLPTALFQLFKRKPVEDADSSAAGVDRHTALLFTASAALATLGFFSLSKVQFETYVLPAWAPLAMLIGISLDGWIKQAEDSHVIPKVLNVASRTVLAAGVAIAIASCVAAVVYHALNPWMRVAAPIAAAVILAGWTRQFFLLNRGQTQQSIVTLLVSTCLFYSIIAPIAIEVWYQAWFADPESLVQSLENSDAQVGQFREYMLGLLFYRKGPVDYFYNPDRVVPRATCPRSEYHDAHGPLVLLVRKKEVNDILNRPGVHFKVLDKSGDWLMLMSTDAVLRRPPTLEWMFGNETCQDMLTDRFHLNLTMPYGGGSMPERLVGLSTPRK